MTSTIIDMIRHGEPVGGKRYRGQIDDPLSDKGWAQRHGLPLAHDARLKEIGFGAWEGKTAAELMASDPAILMNFWRDPLNHTPPGAETLAEFATRITAAWQGILADYAGQHVLLVGHAGQMRMVIRHVLATPLEMMFRIQVENAAITRIQVDGEGEQALPRLIFHGGRL